jgi:putative DNA primase/helicase
MTTYDLRTGVGYRPDPLDYITKKAACRCAPPGTPHPLWSAFLDCVTNHDAELQGFLKRYCGYCCTGFTWEHVFVFAYGAGANGKSTFVNTIANIFGTYATVADMGTFLVSNTERHPTDLAKLMGVRLVVAQEVQKGRRWDETKIKALTGGDPISARFMRQDFFTYVPQFKLFIAGNYMPGLRGVNEAIRRRFNLIPFTVTIPENERDEELPEKLKSEWPGILQWMINGCSSWIGLGLNAPDAVRQATDDYLAAEDTFEQWIEEKCALDPSYFATTAELFTSWKAWTEAAGEFTGSQKRLSQKLEARGFRRDRRGGARDRGFYGIALRP